MSNLGGNLAHSAQRDHMIGPLADRQLGALFVA